MAQNSWPSPAYNDRAVTDVEYEQLAARFSGDGVYGTPSDTAVVSDGAGLSVDIRAGVFASLRGHAWTSGTSVVNLAVASNASGQTRVDRVVLRLDRSDWTVRAVVKTGTPGAGVPSLTQSTGDTGTYEIPLAEVTVLNSAAAVSVTRRELYVGLRHRVCTSTTRNPAPIDGETCYETDTGVMRLWTGTTWQVIFEYSGEIDCGISVSAWEATVSSVLEVKNGIVTFRPGSFRRLSGTLSASSDSKLPAVIPSRYIHPTRDQYIVGYITGAQVCRMQIYSKSSSETARRGQLWLIHHPGLAAGDFVLPGPGPTWVV